MLNHFVLLVSISLSNLYNKLSKIIFYFCLAIVMLVVGMIAGIYVLNRNMYVTDDNIAAKRIMPLYSKEVTLNLKELTLVAHTFSSKKDSAEYAVYQDDKTGKRYGVYNHDNLYARDVLALQLIFKGK